MRIPKLLFALCLAASGVARAEAGAGATIVLPRKLLAGQPATLAVLDASGRLASGVEVEFSGGERKTTDATGRLLFMAPAAAGVLLVSLPGRPGSASATVLSPPAPPPDGVQIVEAPRLITLHDRFSIDGAGFRGEADENHVLLGDQPASVLAASPVFLVALPGPRAAPGPAQLLVEVGGRSPGPTPVTIVTFEVRAEKSPLAAGEKTQLVVRAKGTSESLEIEVRNLSPGVVELADGDSQRRSTQGGAENIAKIAMTGKQTGDFSIEVRLVPRAQGLPDVAAARQELLAAVALAPPEWKPRVQRLIAQLGHHPQDAVKARDALEKMLAQKPEGEFGRRLEAAWKILLNR